MATAATALQRPTSTSGRHAAEPERLERRPCPFRGSAGPPRERGAQQEAGKRQRGEDQGESGDLAEHTRTETLQPLVDERRQHRIAAGNAEKRRDAEIADRRDEGEHRAGEQRRPGERQDHGAGHAARPGAAESRRLDEIARQAAQTRPDGEERQGRVFDAHDQHDAPPRIERVRAARLRREPDRVQDRARRRRPARSRRGR